MYDRAGRLDEFYVHTNTAELTRIENEIGATQTPTSSGTSF